MLANGQVMPRQVQQAPPGGGSFRIEMDHAPQAIRDLEDARNQLEDLKTQAVHLGKVNPPSRDQVSLDAAQVLGTAAAGGAGSLVAAIDAGIGQIEALIGKLRSDLAAYDRTENENVSSLS